MRNFLFSGPFLISIATAAGTASLSLPDADPGAPAKSLTPQKENTPGASPFVKQAEQLGIENLEAMYRTTETAIEDKRAMKHYPGVEEDIDKLELKKQLLMVLLMKARSLDRK